MAATAVRSSAPLPRFASVSAVVLAGALVALAGAPASAAPPTQPECVARAVGETVCGYNCVTAFGYTRCAKTATGVCASGSGVVACWDPPPIVRAVLGDQVPRAECKIIQGRIACGYKCITAHDQVQCAETPWGACAAGDGVLSCGDPPLQVIAALRARTPQESCITGFKQVACGYHCTAGQSLVRCSLTPEGQCIVQRGTVTCFDEPLEARGVAVDGASGLACLQGADTRACGHHCVGNRYHARCGQSDREVCREERDDVNCRLPDE
jgi:hypothetical protein